ncbi:MAG: undecaprenyl-diphosphate phosphatase [Corallococcus sp.]|nr:undecaprenyl-diphosphate phosphatase [Corallococcus sp.]
MTLLESIFLGLLQGFTEFLPVSSSGHLILAQKLFDIDGNLFFDVMLHVGTLAAVIIAFRKSIASMLRHPIKNKKLMYVLLASIPTFAIAFVVKFFLPEQIYSGIALPIGFAVTIVLILLSHFLYKPKFRLDDGGVLPVLICGVVQGVAVFPGLSRSGSTISVLKLFGTEQTDSAEFSFLLSIPVILGGAAVEILEVIKTPITTPWYVIAAGVLFAFLSGSVAIHTVMRTVKSGNWLWFAVYLAIPLILSLLVL